MWGTAQGLLARLTEHDSRLQIHALDALHGIVDTEWPQIADQLGVIKGLARREDFDASESAALLASKVYYHLANMKRAVAFAMLARGTFVPSGRDEFTERVVAHAIKTYCAIEKKNTAEEGLVTIVRTVLDDMLESRKYSQCLCLAIETRFVEYVKQSIKEKPELVAKAIVVALRSVVDSAYRQELLQLFVSFARTSCDRFQLSQLYHALRRPDDVSSLLISLSNSQDSDDRLLSYQIAFDLAENASQKFRSDVLKKLPTTMDSLGKIVTREKLLSLYLAFLFENNKADIQIIVVLKENLDSNNKTLVHSSVIAAYSFMFEGTGDDNFYRSNVNWFATGKKWAQFFTMAAVGAIHIGHLSAAMKVLQKFLQKTTPPYALGGGLYALGLIYANYLWNKDVIDTVVTHLQEEKQAAVVKHGGCLALGLIAMGSHNSDFYDIIASILHEDTPEPGEAAGYASGLIMLGNGPSEYVESLLIVCRRSQHEKVTRGGAMGLAFMMYGKEDECEVLVSDLLKERIPLLRESCAWVTALAYVGTASNVALKRLLHLAVRDANPDVRRAAVIGIGFVLSRSPKDVPGMVDLLAKSYHPHVRSGAALALGISCAGLGMPEAIDILKPLLEDDEDFVKQSAMISMAMVLQQQSDAAVPYAKEFRAYLAKMIGKRRNDLQVFGLCLAYGILNAGGRNVVISCNTLRGENSALATVALALFCNYFYWHPLALMLLLAFHPTAVIGLDKNLEKPLYWEIRSAGDPELYADPPSFSSEKEASPLCKPAPLALSTTKPAPPRAVPDPDPEPVETESRRDFQLLANSSRVTLNQLAGINLTHSRGYRPIIDGVFHGFVMLKEREGHEEDEEEDP